MKKNAIELADVVRQFRGRYVQEFGHVMMPSQTKALADIAACMTAEMGGRQYRCCDCDDETFWVYHGCRNRACPACHGRRTREWLAAREAELLPCDYYHLVATVPEELRHVFLSDQKAMYSLLMKVVAEAVIDLTRDRKYLGATPAILMVLHTWTGQLLYHPHVHLLVSGGGVSDDGRSWRAPPGQFLLPVKALSKLIAAKFRDALRRTKPKVFDTLARKIWKREWCSFCKHYGRGKQAVLDYLARYAFRIAITSTRIIAMDEDHVTFKYKQRDTGDWGTCRLTGVEFLRRFLMHVLPKGFHKVRYYGLWHPSKRRLQQRARLLLSLLVPLSSAECLPIANLAAQADRLSQGKDVTPETFLPRCPRCGSQRVEQLQERRRGPAP
jgi:hypothetical protein